MVLSHKKDVYLSKYNIVVEEEEALIRTAEVMPENVQRPGTYCFARGQ
jgi:hypothetical protein